MEALICSWQTIHIDHYNWHKIFVQFYMSRLMTKPTKWNVPSKDSYQPGHMPSLIRVLVVRMKKAWVLLYPLTAQRRLWSDCGCPGWSESLLGTHSFCWFCHIMAQITFTVCIVLLSRTFGKSCLTKPTKWHASSEDSDQPRSAWASTQSDPSAKSD